MFLLNWTVLFFCMIQIFSIFSYVTSEEVERNFSLNENSDAEKYYNLTVNFEDGFKKIIKKFSQKIMPFMLQTSEFEGISPECTRAVIKYFSGLNQAKLWAVKMLDATSMLPIGIFAGTTADYGSFDECLAVEVPGNPVFRGSSCSVEFRLPLPPLPKKFTIVQAKTLNDSDTVGKGFRDLADLMSRKYFQLIACVPSTCSLQDMQHIAEKASNETGVAINIPKCYVKEEIPLEPVHYAVIAALAILLVMAVLGTVADLYCATDNRSIPEPVKKFLIAFSFPTNLSHLMSPSNESTELKCLHGMKAISICWVVLAHSYMFVSFNALKGSLIFKEWFSLMPFQIIMNGDLSAETFLSISGILVVYGGMKSLTKKEGKLSLLPLMVIRRYLRLTPSLLLVIGLAFLIPFLGSGPFWYEIIDTQLETCRNYWWSTIFYFSNWIGIKEGCLLTTWYLAVEFQLHIFSLIMLFIIFRFTKIGLSLLVICIIISCAAIGIVTVMNDLSAAMLLSLADEEEVLSQLNHVHINTVTHLPSYCIGMILGYYVFKCKEIKLRMWVVVAGWCASATLSLAALLGAYRFATGDETSLAMTVLYASVHRCAFSLGVTWVVFACIAGYGGPVNSLLSHNMWAPLSRLTFMVYLIHTPAIALRQSFSRERPVATHFDFVCSSMGNILIMFVVAFPFYLLLEAPLTNLNRMIFTDSEKQEKEIIEYYNFSDDDMAEKKSRFIRYDSEPLLKTKK